MAKRKPGDFPRRRMRVMVEEMDRVTAENATFLAMEADLERRGSLNAGKRQRNNNCEASSGDSAPETGDEAQDATSNPGEDDFASWLQVLGAFCLNFNIWGIIQSYNAFQVVYQRGLLHSQPPPSIARIGSTQTFLLFFVSIVVGPIFDGGRLGPLLWVGTVILLIGSFLLSVASQYWQVFFTQSVLMGLGLGSLCLTAPAVVAQHFKARTGLAMGVSSAGSAIGGVIYPVIFSRLESHIGFGWATRVLAFIVMAVSIFPVVLMKTKSRLRQGLLLIDQTTLHDLPYVLLNFGLLLGFMGFYTVFYYIELLALDYATVSRHISENILVIIHMSSLPGRIIPGYFADKIGAINMQFSVVFISMILTFCLLVVQSKTSIVVVGVLYGFFSGSFMGLFAAAVVSLSRNRRNIGIRLGITLSFMGVGVLVSTPVADVILGDVNDRNWVRLIVCCGALLAASAITIAASRIARVGMGLGKFI